MSFATTIPLLLGLVIWAGILALVIYLAVLLIKALRKYLKSGPVRQEKAEMARSLGEAIRYHRTRCKMTQEFVAESLGVSRQAVSKWENNLSCPDITILPELASIFGISVDELLGRTPPKEERVHEAEVIKPEEKEHILDYTIGSAARSGLWFAIYVLAIGALFLVNALGKFDVSVWTILWTSALLLGGLSMLTHRFSCFSIGLMLVGGYSLLTAFGFLSIGFRWSVLIPVFLLLWGVSLKMHLHRQSKNSKRILKKEMSWYCLRLKEPQAAVQQSH